MRFVGIDLAWSLRNTHRAETGGVSIDETGRVIASASLTADEAIVAFVLAHTDPDGCIVGIDAPLVVPNETGQRACEAALLPSVSNVHKPPQPMNYVDTVRIADPVLFESLAAIAKKQGRSVEETVVVALREWLESVSVKGHNDPR